MTAELEERLRAMESEWTRLLLTDLAQARAVAEAMMKLAEGAGPAARARALRAHGGCLRATARLPEALTAVTQSKKLWRQAGDEIEWARTVNASIPILVQLDRNREAIRASKTALAMLLRRDEQAVAGRLLGNMGAMYGNMGRSLDALDCFTRAVDLVARTGQADIAAQLQLNRALVLQQLGRHAESLTACALALRHWQKTGARISQAKVLQCGAIALFQMGRFGKALQRFARTRALFESHSSARDVAVCDLYIAACYLELNRYEQTIARTSSVMQVLDPAQNGFQHAWARLYEGVALTRLGQREAGHRSLKLAYRWFEEHGHNPWAGKARLEEAELLLGQGASREAIHAAGKAARLFAASHMQTEEARAHLLSAESNLQAGRVKAAELAAERARPVFMSAHMPGPTFRCLHLLGRVAIRHRDWEKARGLLARAVAIAERMRATVHLSFRRAFLDDKTSAYADLVWVHLQSGRIREARRLADLAKSRGLTDELAAAAGRRRRRLDPADQELLSRIEAVRREYSQLTAPAQLGPEQAVALRGGAATPTVQRAQLEERLAALWDEWELRQTAHLGPGAGKPLAAGDPGARLAPGTAMVEYFAAGARLIAFVSDRRGLRGWVDLGAPDPIRRTLELLQLNLDTGVMMAAGGRSGPPALIRNARALLHDLYGRLWAPLEPLLGERKSVVIIPHGILHVVPFEALHDGQQHLVERMEITLAPSRAVWARCLARADRLSGTADLVVGYNPDGALPFVDVEAHTVAGALGTAPFTDREATAERLAAAGARRVVHVAVHGEFRLDNPYFSTLLLADGPLTAADVAAMHLESSLVVLSGCETGLSRVTRGEELMGMVSAFLQAGSASVLSSRWRVDDRVTAQLMERFYAGLLSGQTKAASLRSAQAAMATQEVHPLFWAAFGLVGHSGRLS